MNTNELKEKYQKELEDYSDQIKAYLNRYGDDKSDYLIHRQTMASYYRGAYNAIIAVEKGE